MYRKDWSAKEMDIYVKHQASLSSKRKSKLKKTTESGKTDLNAKEENSSPDLIVTSKFGDYSDLSMAGEIINEAVQDRPSFFERAHEIEKEVGQIDNPVLNEGLSNMLAKMKADLEKKMEVE